MMFVKSKKSAILMACLLVISAVGIAFVAGEARQAVIPPAERNPNVASGFAGIAVAILLLSIGLASFMDRRG